MTKKKGLTGKNNEFSEETARELASQFEKIMFDAEKISKQFVRAIKKMGIDIEVCLIVDKLKDSGEYNRAISNRFKN